MQIRIVQTSSAILCQVKTRPSAASSGILSSVPSPPRDPTKLPGSTAAQLLICCRKKRRDLSAWRIGLGGGGCGTGGGGEAAGFSSSLLMRFRAFPSWEERGGRGAKDNFVCPGALPGRDVFDGMMMVTMILRGLSELGKFVLPFLLEGRSWICSCSQSGSASVYADTYVSIPNWLRIHSHIGEMVELDSSLTL